MNDPAQSDARPHQTPRVGLPPLASIQASIHNQMDAPWRAIKCDDCRATIGTTQSVAKSAEGGLCRNCRASDAECRAHNQLFPCGDCREA